MGEIRFVKEPGHTYNVLQIFSMYFNKAAYQKEPLGYQYAIEDREYFDNVLKPYLPISDELLVFFYMPDCKISFMTNQYYLAFESDFCTGKYNVAFLQNKLANYDEVVTYLYKFYFPDISDEMITECKESVKKMNDLVRSSKYDAVIKGELLSFFIDPVPLIQKLSYELMVKDFMLNQEYEKNIQAVTEFQNNMSFETLKNHIEQLDEYSCAIEDLNEIHISVGLNLRKMFLVQYYQNKVLFVTGLDYLRYFDYLLSRKSVSELDCFGDIISEINRLKILELIYQKREITIKDVESELGFTATNSYYHLSMMIKAGMLKTRNRGRTILYSINKVYFASITEAFSKFAI